MIGLAVLGFLFLACVPFAWIGSRKWGGAKGAVYGFLVGGFVPLGCFYLIGWLIGSFFAHPAPTADEDLPSTWRTNARADEDQPALAAPKKWST